MRRVLASVVALLGLTAVGLATAPTVAGADPSVPPGATVVGTAGPNCSSPSFSTIQAAINAASANDTIYVCPGSYNESLTINKPLTIDGAQYGVDARTRSVPDETVLDATDGIQYAAGATSGTISGFTLGGFSTGNSYIVASNVGAGWNFTDNILDASGGGIYVNTDGITNPAASTIADNRFIQTTPSWAPSGYYGQAVSVWGNTGNNISISNNSFTNLSGPGAAINTTGTGSCGSSLDGTNFSTNLTISGNTFTDNGASFVDPNYGPGFIDENFLALFCSNDAQVTNNTVTITDANDANAETPIYMGGGNWNTSVTGNHLIGNGTSDASGIQLNSNFYAPGTGVGISANTASGFYYGIHVTGSNFGENFAAPSGYTVSHNTISGSLENGIEVNPGSDNSDSPSGTLSDNSSTGSAAFDCFDSTSGSGTLGTADTWTNNDGATSSPSGLCGLPPAFTTATSTTFTDGVAGTTFTPGANGTPTPTITESGALPSGIHFSGGALSGTPTVVGGGTFHITFTASNGYTPNATQAFTLTVRSAPAFTSANTATFTKGVAGTTFMPKASGTPAPTITKSAGTLPAGVTFTGGKLKGTPTVTGTFHLTFKAANGVMPNATQSFTLKVLGLHVVTGTLPPGKTGKAYSTTLSAAGGTAPYTWTVVKASGTLPKGIFLKNSGVLSGTPTQKGSFTFTVHVADNKKYGDSATAVLKLVIS